MKKKIKLFSTIASLCLAVALMAFGVWAATSVKVTINSKVSFDVSDVFVDVAGTAELKGEAEAKGTYSAKSYTLSGEDYTPVAALDPAVWNIADIAMTSEKDVVTYTITIKNVSKENNVSVTVTADNILQPTGTSVEKKFVNDTAAEADLTSTPITVAAEKTLTITVKVTLLDKSKAISAEEGKVMDGVEITIAKA